MVYVEGANRAERSGTKGFVDAGTYGGLVSVRKSLDSLAEWVPSSLEATWKLNRLDISAGSAEGREQ